MHFLSVLTVQLSSIPGANESASCARFVDFIVGFLNILEISVSEAVCSDPSGPSFLVNVTRPSITNIHALVLPSILEEDEPVELSESSSQSLRPAAMSERFHLCV